MDANYGNRGELYLFHRHEGVDIDVPWAKDTLKNLYTIWGRPVFIESVDGQQRVIYGYGPEGSTRQELM